MIKQCIQILKKEYSQLGVLVVIHALFLFFFYYLTTLSNKYLERYVGVVTSPDVPLAVWFVFIVLALYVVAPLLLYSAAKLIVLGRFFSISLNRFWRFFWLNTKLLCLVFILGFVANFLVQGLKQQWIFYMFLAGCALLAFLANAVTNLSHLAFAHKKKSPLLLGIGLASQYKLVIPVLIIDILLVLVGIGLVLAGGTFFQQSITTALVDPLVNQQYQLALKVIVGVIFLAIVSVNNLLFVRLYNRVA